MRRRLTPLVFLPALVAAACGRNAGPALYPVKGTAFFDGKPAAGAVITFHPRPAGPGDPGALPHATVGPEGAFEITTFVKGDGAPPGRYRVTVIWRKKKAKGGDE